MKTPQVQSVIGSIAVLAAFISASNSAWAWPPQFTPEQVASMQPLDPAEVPRFGTFYLLQGPYPGSPTPPLPCPPGDLTNAPIYALGEDHFLVDDSQVDYEALRQEREAINAALSALEAEYGLASPMGPEGGGPLWPLDGNPSNSLWLSISQITNGIAPLVIHGTVPDATYELLSKQTLTDAAWFSEGTVPGAPDQEWTPTAVAMGARTNSLFLWCRSWVSSNGSGIPHWWLLQYFGTTDIDPYTLCPSGDGWTILQAWQNGWNPNLFYTPPPPQNVTAVLAPSEASATITWTSGGGPVTNYAIYSGGCLGQVDSATFSFTDSWGSPPYDFIPDYTYVVRAYFANGAYADSQPARFTAARLSSSMAVVRDSAGQLTVALGSLPRDLSSVRVY